MVLYRPKDEGLFQESLKILLENRLDHLRPDNLYLYHFF